jgi:hypothetical protein
MAKYLRLGEERWTLPPDADLDSLRAVVSGAMNEGTAVGIEVVLDRGGTADLLINGKAVRSVLMWEEESASRPSFTMID